MASALRKVARIVTAHRQREGGGFIVRRPVGGEVDQWSPFLMLDHLGPSNYGPGEAVGAPDHPHRGFETVTYILSGSWHHQDSAGNEGKLGPGWVQWMTAGSGVVHSEMPTKELLENGGTMEGFQLWVNLPKKDKMIPPRYQDTPPEKMPIVKSNDGAVWVKVVAGSYEGTQAVIETRTPIHYLDVRLQPGAAFSHSMPANFNVFLYCYKGHGSTCGSPIKEGQAAFYSAGEVVEARAADAEFRFLLLGGQPINEPVARYGPFVMNTQDEIRQAFMDYQNGKLGAIEGSEERYATTHAAKSQQKRNGNWDKGEL
eukprot:TRINITY_DN2036_c0_g1::TRINITY_DN2036_c0_g1_i1::g.21792::m.21792 TRINITY_DN2036_c0_g1::TRINITY_DN2036_c0_g1_i1::g.21792  ORF type:complete len:314 (+),score=59.99,sp/Q9SEE4/PIRL_SOLLC/46.08/6e-74,Pirin/PF02678.11/1.5e-34,Pirin_C/PF05726.8/1.9e+03,Pirin_C/PF05726.8/9.4e+02,Pirin_C/PF05726.8/7.3e-33,Cupin_2/PF07883.6/0.38,Cupin_2/PF07883.6/4.9e+02 TRINITY_DN2036_c0_g1_i1:131-1072(+)